MKRLTAFILLLVTLVFYTGVARADSSVLASNGDIVAVGGRLDLRSEFYYDSTGEKQQIKVTVSTDTGYSACETRIDYSEELVEYAVKYEVNPDIEAIVDISVKDEDGVLYMTCYKAPGDVPGDIVTLYFDVFSDATGTASFDFLEGCIGRRTGLDLPDAVLGDSAANELLNGLPAEATRIVSADAVNGEVRVTFDGALSEQWSVICAAYSAEGRMLRCKMTSPTAVNNLSIALGADAGDTVKIFVLSDLKPVMASLSFTVQ